MKFGWINGFGGLVVIIMLAFALIAFTAFMVIGRLISGVHWITDIIGGAILSAGLVMIYYSVTTLIARQER